MNQDIKVARSEMLLNQLVVVDGQPGSGKSMLATIVASMDRSELYNYCVELENICGLRFLEKVSSDAAETFIRIQVDLFLYETMMSRRTNFRFTDISSAFRDVDKWKYIFRLFRAGDEVVPERIKKERPILLFQTHSLLCFSSPLFQALGRRLTFIEVIRHPLYMIIQQTLNQKMWSTGEGRRRQFQLYLDHESGAVPFWNLGDEAKFNSSLPVERAIFEMYKIFQLTNKFREECPESWRERIITIPFERLATDPSKDLEDIQSILGSKITAKTRKTISQQRVPRAKFADGIPLAVYKRCGWEPSERGASERQELDKRREFAVKEGASPEALDLLDTMSLDYEKAYLEGIL